jgi:DNA polymerase-3 subunit epsilon
MRFIAIDLETANPRMSSICQIGVVVFEDGREIAADVRLVDPADYFDSFNVAIHGITPLQIRGAPVFSDLHPWLDKLTSSQIVACHTHFDRIALTQACASSAVSPLSCGWLDTAMVARRAWVQFARSGYGLANLAEYLGITFQHHDALHDARTCGLILLRAMEATGYDPQQWIDRCSHTIFANPGPIRREGDGDGSLVGERIVFTGSLEIARKDAADLAHEAGAAVEPDVNKWITMLIVGDQDIGKLNGQEKSNKHRKAEHFMQKGYPIRILGEADFMAMCRA